MPCYKMSKSIMTAAHYKIGNDDDKSDNNKKSDNKGDKVCSLLRR